MPFQLPAPQDPTPLYQSVLEQRLKALQQPTLEERIAPSIAQSLTGVGQGIGQSLAKQAAKTEKQDTIRAALYKYSAAEDMEKALGASPKTKSMKYEAMFSLGITPPDFKDVELSDVLKQTLASRGAPVGTVKEAGAAAPYLKPEKPKEDLKTFAQKEEIKARLRSKYKDNVDTSRLIETVLNNPESFDTLSPNIKAKILPDLADAGFVYEGKPLSTEAARVSENAQSGLRSLSTAEKIIGEDPKQIAFMAIPGSLGARKLKAASDEIVDVLQRLRTGAAINEQELVFYNNKLPTISDLSDPEAIKYKLGLFKHLFEGLAKRQKSSTVKDRKPPPPTTQAASNGQSEDSYLKKLGL